MKPDFQTLAFEIAEVFRKNQYAGPSLQIEMIAKLRGVLEAVYNTGRKHPTSRERLRMSALLCRAVLQSYHPGKDAEWDGLRADILAYLNGEPEKCTDPAGIGGLCHCQKCYPDEVYEK